MNILMISPGNISKQNGGAVNRMFNLAEQLHIKNNVIILEPYNSKSDNHAANGLHIYGYFGKLGNRFVSVFADVNPFFILNLTKLLLKNKIDIVQVEFPWGVFATKIVGIIIRKKTYVVYDSHNVQKNLQKDLCEYYKKFNQSKLYDIVISSLIYQYTKIIEPLAVYLSDYVLCVSELDADLFMSIYNPHASKVKVIPNGTHLARISDSKNICNCNLDKSNFRIIFHGSYEYPPNVEAINIIKSKIVNAVKEDIPNVQFIVAGPGVPVYSDSNLIFMGFVEDIYSLIKSCDIAIVPIINGGGTKLKVLDYLSAGLPIISTRKGVEGLNVINGENAIIIDTVNNEFIDAIKFLLLNKDERIRLGTNAHKLAEEYSWNSVGEKLCTFYNSLVKRKE